MEQRRRQSCGLDVEGAPGIDEWQSLNQDRRIECSLDTEKCFSQFGCGVCKIALMGLRLHFFENFNRRMGREWRGNRSGGCGCDQDGAVR